MDDRTTGMSDENMAGFGEEDAVGRADEGTTRRRTSTPATPERTRGRSDDRLCGSASVADREETTAEPRTEQIRAEIEQTREDLAETVDAIQDRLRPRNIAANAAESVRDTASAAVSTVRDAAGEALDEVTDSRVVQEIRANPVPAIMVGVGIVGAAWLAFAGRDARRRTHRRTEIFDHGRSVGYYEPREDYYRRSTVGGMPETAGAYAATEGTGTSAVREVASRTGEYAREVGARARYTTRRAQNQLQRAMNENPLAIGAAALVIGALIGMALPETEKENELLGETRDNVVAGAQELARNAANRVQEVASDAAKRVQDAVSDPVGLLTKDQDKNR